MSRSLHPTRPIALDLCCGAGGSSMGLWHAGFYPIGIDKHANALKRYPFPSAVADLSGLSPNRIAKILRSTLGTRRSPIPALIHASPPCQHDTNLRTLHKGNYHENLIRETRELITRIDPDSYIIENVEGAKERLISPITLCGSSYPFGCGLGGIAASSSTRIFALISRLLAVITTGNSTCRPTPKPMENRPTPSRCTARSPRESGLPVRCQTLPRHSSHASRWALTGCPVVSSRKRSRLRSRRTWECR